MKTKLSSSEFEFLTSAKFLPADLVAAVTRGTTKPGYILELPDEQAGKIRERCADRLQKNGFDRDYDLTKEGETLEALVDKLQTPLETVGAGEKVFFLCSGDADVPSRVKTPQGADLFIAFASSELAQTMLSARRLEDRINIVSIEILSKRPQLEKEAGVFLISSKEALESYLRNPQTFPYQEYTRSWNDLRGDA
jgi:hypothetical protein